MTLAQLPVTLTATSVPWEWWIVAGAMILLQMMIFVAIAGRPSAIAVMGVTLPFLCGVCGLCATGIILTSTDAGNVSIARIHPLIPLLYVIWILCGIVALVTVVLCLVLLARRTPSPRSVEEPKPKVAVSPVTEEVKALS